MLHQTANVFSLHSTGRRNLREQSLLLVELNFCPWLSQEGADQALSGECSYLRRATEGGRRAIVFDVLLAEPKVSKDNVSL